MKYQDIDKMDTDEISQKMQEIQALQKHNLTAKYFAQAAYSELPIEQQERFKKIIATCIANPDSAMGCYAMAGDDYDLFSNFFEPVIRDYHNITPDKEISQMHDWSGDAGCNLTHIDPALKNVSMRVRVARNVQGFPLPGAMTQKDRTDLENVMITAFKTLINMPAYGGQYLSLTPNSPYQISDKEYQARIDAHQMFKDMSGDRYLDAANISGDWPYGRGMYISEEEDFIVWVGEEDHLRIMSMKSDGDLSAMFARLEQGLRKIEEALDGFAHSERFGYVTSCPTNLGAGMRASLHIQLPNLTEQGQNLDKVKELAKEHGLAVRGAGGEHSDAGQDGLVDLSPSARLGVTEKQIMQKLFYGVKALWQAEKQS